MSNFYTDVIQADLRYNSPQVINDMDLLEPNFRQMVQAILAQLTNNGIDMMVFETYRSIDRQKDLYAQGVTQIPELDVHHFGLACDIVYRINGQPSWNGDFQYLGESAHLQHLIWGGDWPKFKDLAHVQWCSVPKQSDLFNGNWYPSLGYDPTIE